MTDQIGRAHRPGEQRAKQGKGKFTIGENKDKKMVDFGVFKESDAVEDKEYRFLSSFL